MPSSTSACGGRCGTTRWSGSPSGWPASRPRRCAGARAPDRHGKLLITHAELRPRLVLSGPFASDWNDLTPQEKIGRINEGVVYWGLIIGILSSI